MKDQRPKCRDCEAGLPLSADAGNHVLSERVGDVRACRYAANSTELLQMKIYARTMANCVGVAYVIYRVEGGTGLEFAARRSDFNVPLDLLPHWSEFARFAPTTLDTAPAGELGEDGEGLHEPFIISTPEMPDRFEATCRCGKWSFTAETKGAATTGDDLRELLTRALASYEGHAIFNGALVIGAPHELQFDFTFPDMLEASCLCGAWSKKYRIEGDNEPARSMHEAELREQAAQEFPRHIMLNVKLVTAPAPVNVSRETSKDVHELILRIQPDLFGACSCGRWQYDSPRLFESAIEAEKAVRTAFNGHVAEVFGSADPLNPPKFVSDRPNCGAPGCLLTADAVNPPLPEPRRCARCKIPLCFPHFSTPPEEHECQGEGTARLTLDLEYAEETTPPAHALKIEWLAGDGKATEFNAATFASATCSCGDFKTSRLLDHQTTEEAYRRGMTTEFDAHLGAMHGVGSGTEVKSKKEQIINLYESGVTDIAQIVRRVAARPSYVAQVLQSAGLITGYFDLYTTTAREQNVYTRFFKNVLDFKTVERARESVTRINRLYDYFERLGDRAGQHQAMILALTGKNRARWSGKIEESEVFSEWLKTH